MRSRSVFDYARKTRTVSELERQTHNEDFWNDPAAAQRVMKQLAEVRADIERIAGIEDSLREARETLELLGDEPGAEAEADTAIAQAERALGALEIEASFSGEFDDHNAIVTIYAGAGGVDAADWTQMLLRMYLRWAETKGFATQIADESAGEEAGLKSVTFFVRGRNAYGLMESERGVHRLVRISPFDAAHRRHTSFAGIDVIPEIEAGEASDIELRPEDLRVETFKAGGAGGQYVNKTESAVRVIHIPTNTIVASQQERSQMQNREVAMNILRAKLVQRELEARDQRLTELRGERKATEWGSQIRSYVLNPYSLVKDHRTNVETGNTQAVLDGAIDLFIWPYLQQRRPAEAAK